MKFLNEQGQEISLKRAENLPGYEVTLSEDVVIDSAVNNPFFKGINILQLPKKLKGFRENSDLKTLFAPQVLNVGLKIILDEDECAIFEPAEELVLNQRLILVNRIFGTNQIVRPMFINFGLRNVKLRSKTVIGTVLIQKNNIEL
ncbi:hypothetical protein G9403_01635 [Weissella paramesenteroides]|uniref:Uncharacterized protein n=1 Tax=Weissella paramesenteroides TaxID=1249 RepID=A0ABD4XGY0_WEIPA|nr:hypothetical protein [Weissella paramesenteroides]MDF8368450.1 hypothetical protein [Weissella paramesenteroides]MDF8370361.1 hypothetical protein [Weissella paramesenteroides]